MDTIPERPTAMSVGKAALRRAYARLMQRKLIGEYLATHDIVKIGIGAGGSRREGWLSTDYDPPARDIVYLDATKPFPLADASVDYFVAEHMIEHITLADGLFMLRECLRTLKAGGKIRIATPDIKRYQPFLNGAVNDDAGRYVRWSNETFGGAIERSMADSGIVTFNRIVREWGHKFLYDPTTLIELLTRAGFTNIVCCAVGESEDSHLKGIELRAGGAFDFANSFETMVFEAQKPTQ